MVVKTGAAAHTRGPPPETAPGTKGALRKHALGKQPRVGSQGKARAPGGRRRPTQAAEKPVVCVTGSWAKGKAMDMKGLQSCLAKTAFIWLLYIICFSRVMVPCSCSI